MEVTFVFLNEVGQGGAGAASFSRLESKVPDVLLCSWESLTTPGLEMSCAHSCRQNPHLWRPGIRINCILYTTTAINTHSFNSVSSMNRIPYKLRKGPAWLRVLWRAAGWMSRNHVTDAYTGPAHKAGSPPQCCRQALAGSWSVLLLHVPSLLFFLNVTVILRLCFLFRIRCVGWHITY